VGDTTPFKGPRFVPSERTLTATVSPSARIASIVICRSGELGQEPLGGLSHGLRTVHPPRGALGEGHCGVLEVIHCHYFVTYFQVLLVEELLEVAPDEFFVGLRHGYSFIFVT
jgi:hypothetical protein